MERREGRDGTPGYGSVYDTPILSTDTVTQFAGSAVIGAGLGYAVGGLSVAITGAETGVVAFGVYELWKEWDFWFGGTKGIGEKISYAWEQYELWWVRWYGGSELADEKTVKLPFYIKAIVALQKKYKVTDSLVATMYRDWMNGQGYDYKDPTPKQLMDWVMWADKKLEERQKQIEQNAATASWRGLMAPTILRGGKVDKAVWTKAYGRISLQNAWQEYFRKFPSKFPTRTPMDVAEFQDWAWHNYILKPAGVESGYKIKDELHKVAQDIDEFAKWYEKEYGKGS